VIQWHITLILNWFARWRTFSTHCAETDCVNLRLDRSQQRYKLQLWDRYRVPQNVFLFENISYTLGRMADRNVLHCILGRLIDQELITYRYSSCGCCCCSSSCFCWGDLFKKAKSSVVSNRIGMKFGRIVLQVNTHRLTSPISDMTSYFQDGGHDVISRRKVSPPGKWRRSVCPAAMQQRPPVIEDLRSTTTTTTTTQNILCWTIRSFMNGSSVFFF